MDVVITGGDQLYVVAKRLRGADKVIRKELLQGIRDGAKPVTAAVKANALAVLPNRGGLAALVSKSSVRVQTNTSAGKAGVRIVAKNAKNIYGMDQGRLRHPVFGNRTAWVEQSVPPGWFTKPIEASAETFRGHIIQAIDRAAQQIE